MSVCRVAVNGGLPHWILFCATPGSKTKVMRMANFKEYTKYDGLGLAELIRKKEISVQEAIDASLTAANAVDPQLNAIVRDMSDEAQRSVDAGVPNGPFAGVPFMIKDFVINYAGVETRSGSRLCEGFEISASRTGYYCKDEHFGIRVQFEC